MVKAIVSLMFRFLVGFGILFLLSKSFNLTEALSAIFSINIWWAFFALSLILGLRIVVVFRWKIILDYQKLFVPFIELVKINYISTALGQVLPGGVGGDLLRGYKLSKKYKQPTDTASSIVYDRVIGILSMFFIALVGSIIAKQVNLQINISLQLTFLFIITVFFFITGYYLKAKLDLIDYNKFGKAGKFAKKVVFIINSLTDLNKLKAIFLSVFTISIFVQLVRIVIFYFIFLAFGFSPDFVYFLIIIPITLFLAIIPISIAGLGVREGTLIFFFSSIGIPAEVCISVGVFFHILQIIASIPGIFMWIFESFTVSKN